MALSTQKGCSFYAFKLQISIFSLYVAMWVKAIFKRGNKTQREREREREREQSCAGRPDFKGYNGGKSSSNFDMTALLM
jgi:hypothetical protein